MSVWVLLACAVACETTATLALRMSEGFSKFWPAVVVVIGYCASFVLLSLILRTGLAIGIVYALWSAFGVTLVSIFGVLLFDDELSRMSAFGIFVVIVGVVLVQWGTSGDAAA